VGPIESISDPQDAGQPSDNPAVLLAQAPEIRVALPRKSPPVIPRDIGDQLDFMGRKAGQVAMHDQVVSMLVVLGVVDDVANVVQ
jgi:hypothetical protein